METEKGKRLVLFPFGQAQDQLVHDRCDEVLIRCCDADIERFIERRMVLVDEYLKFIGRLSDVTTGSNPPIVVITDVNDLALNVIKLRRVSTQSFPMLSRSLWILCMDPAVDLFFIPVALRLGTLSADIDHAPIWRVQETGDCYLVLTPKTTDLSLVRHSIARITAIQDPQPLRRKYKATMPFPQPIDPSSTRKP